MLAFVVRRITQALFVMLIISLVGFSIKNKIGDPVRDLVGERVTPAERELLRDKLGLNDHVYHPIPPFRQKCRPGGSGHVFFP